MEDEPDRASELILKFRNYRPRKGSALEKMSLVVSEEETIDVAKNLTRDQLFQRESIVLDTVPEDVDQDEVDDEQLFAAQSETPLTRVINPVPLLISKTTRRVERGILQSLSKYL